MSENKNVHCPNCHKPLLSGGRFWGSAQFAVRCPWCQTISNVAVQQQIIATRKSSNTPHIQDNLIPDFDEYKKTEIDKGKINQEIYNQNSSTKQKSFKLTGYLYSEEEQNHKRQNANDLNNPPIEI